MSDSFEVTSLHTCDFSGEWEYDADKHWKECECGLTSEEGTHTGGTATCTAQAECDICGTAYGELADHNTNGSVEHVDATCTETGVEGGTYCTACDYGKAEAEKVIPVLGHGETEIRGAKEATATEDGYTGDTYCKACGEKLATGEVIPATGTNTPEDPSADSGACEICNNIHTSFFHEIICFFHMLINLITSFFTFTC